MTLDEQLKRLEEDVRRLKIEFDVFFNGGAKRPPHETKGRIESTIKRLGEERSMKFGQRYYYNTIVARYVSFKELWRRTMQEREEGTQRGRLMPEAQVQEEEAPQFKPVQVAFSSGQEVEEARHLYDSLLQAKDQCGEVNNVSFDQFQRLIATRTVQLREKLNCQKVAYEVVIEDGLVKFKARPV
ncbi:MAG TPA: MXAN_5187 C-terminal domain-containing protein [Blastocatellia bacterium]|nr:MXAN_5187 C-terminal domain-containing protein [Blastocatellia bacterium]